MYIIYIYIYIYLFIYFIDLFMIIIYASAILGTADGPTAGAWIWTHLIV